MFDRPFGSPLDPMRRQAPLGALGAAPSPIAPQAALAAQQPLAAPPAALSAPSLTSIPTPPASIKRKRLNPFDKDHIARTLADIGKGLAQGNGNLGQGIAMAASNVAGSVLSEREGQKGTTEIGGPDNAFEIHTDAEGNRTFKRIAEVQSYLDGKEKAKNAPTASDTAALMGDSLYAVEQLDEAQRPGAYQLLLQQAAAAGHDVSSAPPEYSPTFSKAMIQRTIGARQGSANAATAANRAEIDADRDRSWTASNARAEAASGRAASSAARAAQSHGRRMSAPPSTRRGSKTGDLDYLK